jgi:exodeoxyribonuclease V beta subunit
MEKKGFFSPDLLVTRCCQASRIPAFCDAVQSCYEALIVDEFQDTDGVQWEIIERLFKNSVRVLCLVGDPKQSIYRFRKADLYTYFRARALIGEENCYSLDTNYRSTPELVSALNDLFRDEHTDPWLLLPQEGRAISYLPVKAGSAPYPDLGDGKKALQFFEGKDPLISVAAEIVRLYPTVGSYSCFAVLVKDHVEAAEAQSFLQGRGVPAVLRNRAPLSRSPAFRICEERFDRLHIENLPFDLPSLLRTIEKDWSLQKHDFYEIAEHLLASKAYSFQQIKRIFRTLEREETVRLQEQREDAVRILTLHASKGLEFEIVFALGVARGSPEEEEKGEQEAEKLRLLYVAFTRAKRRLYVPLERILNSPLDLFLRRSKMELAELIQKNPNIGIE